MANRIEVLRDIAKELGIPIANTCNEIDIQRIILQTLEMEDRGDDDCLGYLFADGDPECLKCEAIPLCKRICLTQTPVEDESMKGVRWVSPNLTSYGFNRGSQGKAVVDLLLVGPRSTEDIKKFLVKEFKSTDEKAQQMWNYIKDKLKQSGYAVLFDSQTKLNTLVDKTESELDAKVRTIAHKIVKGEDG